MSATRGSIDGRFFFQSRIGAGGVGEVWRGIQQPLGRPVAIKLLRRELSADAATRRRFAREARAASSLNHQNIISLYDFGTDPEGQLYIAMEFADGRSLADVLREGVVLSAEQVLDLADQLLAGLAHAHARGVVHRDLKPDNVMFSQQRLPASLGVAKIVDFGIASLGGAVPDDDETDLSKGRMAIGTPRYMSPEQALGNRNLSPRTDLYNVGLLLWEAASGRPLFGELEGIKVMEHHVYEDPPDLREHARVELPESFHTVVEKALAKKPLMRWASAGEMREALSPAMNELSRVGWRPRTTPRVRQRGSAQDVGSDLPVIPRLPLVGRTSERRLLEAAVGRALDTRRGSIVLVEGSAGVGKSRLVNWARELVEEAGTMRANTGAYTQGDRSNLRGVQEVFETIFRTRGYHRSDVAARVGARLSEWGHEAPEDRDAVVDFLRPRSDMPARPHEISRLFAVLARVLAVVAEPQPRLIVLEDLHWAGPETLDFLDYLAVEFRQRDMPVVIIGTYRPEEVANRPNLANRIAALSRYVGESVERVELGSMPLDAALRLVEAVLPVTSEVADVVVSRSEGVPLHIITLLQFLRDEELLTHVDGRWRPTDLEAVRQAVPPDIGDLFDRRLKQAQAHYNLPLKRVARIAAVAGLRFDYPVVERAARLAGLSPVTFEDSFDALLRDEFVVTDTRGGDAYTFSHALLRDWLLNDAHGADWSQLHHWSAQAKEELVGNRVSEHGFDIAWHWREAGEWLRAVDWYERTAVVARPNYAPRQAARALKAAVRLVDEQLGLDTDVVHPFNAAVADGRFDMVGFSKGRLLQMLLTLGDLYEGFGEFDAAERTFRRVVVQVGPSKPGLKDELRASLAHAWLGIGHVARQRGDIDAAWWAFERVLELAKDMEQGSTVYERATRGLARLSWLKSDYLQARRWAEFARESASGRGDTEGEAVALWILGDIARVQGDHNEAADLYQRSLALHQESAHQVGIARNLLSLAQLARHRHQWTEAQDLFERALDLWRRLGNRRGAGLALNGLGDLARFQKRFGDAEAHYAEAAEIFESIGAKHDLAVVRANSGINALGLGRLEDAERLLDEARELIADQDYPYLEAGIDFHRALLLEHRQAGHDPADAPVPELDYALPLEQMAELRAERGARNEARTLLVRARDIYARLGLSAEVERLTAQL